MDRKTTFAGVLTWNAHALLHRNPHKRRRKFEHLEYALRNVSHATLQEVHGSEPEILKAFARFRLHWHVLVSASQSRNEGGIVLLLRKASLAAEVELKRKIVVPGRVIKAVVQSGDKIGSFWGVHNFGLHVSDLQKITSEISREIDSAKENPMKRTVIVAGDWNFLAPGEKQHSLAAPTRLKVAADAITPVRQHQSRWQAIIDNLTELQQTDLTHYVPGSLTEARLDRVYTTSPSWALINAGFCGSVVKSARESHETGLSDHAAVVISAKLVPALPEECRPIPRYVTDNKKFIEFHDALCAAIRLDSLPAMPRLRAHKLVIREAARLTRNHILEKWGDEGQARNITLNSVARSIIRNDGALARKLIQRSNVAAELVHIDSTGDVVLVDAERFQKEIEESQRQRYDDLKDRVMKEGSNHPKKAYQKKEAFTRLAKAWAPIDKRLVLAGIRTTSDRSLPPVIVREPKQRAQALAQRWTQTFAAFDGGSNEERKVFCQKWGRKVDFTGIPLPAEANVSEFLDKVKDGAPGPDGIPYSAWRAAGQLGSLTLHLVLAHLANGGYVPIWFNDSLSVFTAKGDDAQDEHEVTRCAEDTRPLGLKNCDNKVVAGVVNHVSRTALSSNASRLQRGFVPDRQMIENVLDLDTAARIYGARGHEDFEQGELSTLCPLISLWDLMAAFPSVKHGWLFVVIENAGFPSGWINIIKAMYTLVRTFARCDADLLFLYWVLSGVLQGCPLSGMIFAFAIDPFLRKLSSEVDDADVGCTRACADDVGGALSCIAVLPIYKSTFDLAATLAGLTLKPKKCVLIPIAAEFNAKIIDKVKAWLLNYLPGWKDFNILPFGTYLGFQIGPSAGATQWDKPLAKFREAANAIALTRSSAAISVHNYNMRAVPTLGYKAQLTLAPNRIKDIERPSVLHVMHFATNSLNNATLFALSDFGGPQVRSIYATTLAALSRTARKTLPLWSVSATLLEKSGGDHLPINTLINGRRWDQFWDSPPVAILMDAAANHFTAEKVARLDLPGGSFLARNRASIERASRAAGRTLDADPNLHIQRTYYDSYLKELYCELSNGTRVGAAQTRIFEQRLAQAFASLCNPVPVIDWGPAARMLRAIPTNAAVTVFKTWANSWATSARYHDGKLDHCAFGCPNEQDSLEHYLACGPLWSSTAAATSHPQSDNVLQRLCITSPSRGNILDLVVAHGLYHTLKMQYLEKVRAAKASNDWEHITELAQTIAATLAYDWSSLNRGMRPTGLRHTDRRISQKQSSVECGPPAGVVASPAPGAPAILACTAASQQDFCEPECSDFPCGVHHPSCALAILGRQEDEDEALTG